MVGGPGDVDAALAARLGAGSLARAGEDGEALLSALRSATEGGKRFRPWLVEAVHHAYGGQRPDAVAPVGAGVELLHTAFVVHDDVIDGDATRRGQPSVPERFRTAALERGASPDRARVYGLAGAVLTGDLALSAAVRAVATAPTPPAVTTRLLDLVDDALAVTASGELADVRLSTHPGAPALADVLSMEEQKTAVYSFALPMQLGAVLADADDTVVRAVGDVGRLLGAAFQLQDDLLGVFGDPAETGKSRICDLREGKATALVTHARGTSSWPLVERHWGDPDLTEDGAAEVRRLLRESGSRAYVETLVVDHVDAAGDAGRSCGFPAELLVELSGLCVLPVRGAA